MSRTEFDHFNQTVEIVMARRGQKPANYFMTNHVPPLETCQKLKKAGFPQETLFHWNEDIPGQWDVTDYGVTSDSGDSLSVAAPLLTEIMELLPVRDASNDHLQLTKGLIRDQVGYEIGFGSVDGPIDENPVEAAALLWLELNKTGGL